MEIKTKNPNKIIEKFNQAGLSDEVNWKHDNGSIFLICGILSKLDNENNQYFAMGGKWVKC